MTAGTIAGAVGTARRKLARSIERRGVAGTIRRAAAWPAAWIADKLRPAHLARDRRERVFDRRHGVDTRRDLDPGWMARIASPNWRHGRGYAPVDERDFARSIERLPIDPRAFVFVDVGAGKGKALLLASCFPFRRVIGVEYAPRLARVAAQNLLRYRPAERHCHEAEVLEMDAADFEPPAAPLVVFFAHPFDAPVFRPVIERLCASLAAAPRPLWVVYHDPQCGALFEAAGFRRWGPEDSAFAIYAAPGTAP